MVLDGLLSSPRARFSLGEIWPEQLTKLDFDGSAVVFIYNADPLDAVHIDPDTGDMYPDLPREVWGAFTTAHRSAVFL